MNLDKRVNSKTKLTGLIGNPLEHTVSPVLQNSLFSSMNLNGIYIPLSVPKEGLGHAVNGLKAFRFKGFNVTIPYKSAIFEYLDEVSEEAELLGAVNTVNITEDRLTGESRLCGHNTDGDGFIRAFREQTGTTFADRKVCILGAGGTARALSVKVALEGARGICIINRTESRAQQLAEKVNQIIKSKADHEVDLLKGSEYEPTAKSATEPQNECIKDLSNNPSIKRIKDSPIKISSYSTRPETTVTAAVSGSPESRGALKESDIIINATSIGMYPNIDASPLEDDFPFEPNQIIYDVIYNPAETKLMSLARRKGCVAVNGSGMLFYQGVKAFEIWMETTVPPTILNALSAAFPNFLEA